MMEMTENHENTAFLLNDTCFSFFVVSKKRKKNYAVTVILVCVHVWTTKTNSGPHLNVTGK